MDPVTTAPQRQRFRRGCFTLNNPTDQEYHWLTVTWPSWPKRNPTWMIVGKEVGETGTSHLQGAFTLSGAVDFSTIKTWPGFRRAHLEQMRGTPLDSKVYCSKQDFAPFEFGIPPTPGKRSDIADACQAIKDGMTLKEMTDEHSVVVVKYYKGLTVLRSLRSGPRDPDALPPSVYWLHGKTGTGKTRCSWQLGCKLSSPSDIWFSNGGTQWFDGYDGQRVAIFDDFRAKGTKFEFLLRITDRYPLQVPFKGGFVNWKPDYIVFTTPNDVSQTFAVRKVHIPEDVAQLERRITDNFCLDWPEERARFEDVLSSIGKDATARQPVDQSTSMGEVTRIDLTSDGTATADSLCYDSDLDQL